MTTINIENLYRGTVETGQRFYLAARLNPDSGSSAAIKTDLNLSSSDPQFLLCLNRFEKGGIKYHRLYWSNDPADYMPQLEANAENQGAVNLSYSSDLNQDFLISYDTSLNYQVFNNNITTYGMENINKTVNINSQRYNKFILSTDQNINYNVANIIYSGVASQLTSSNGDKQNWIFRKKITSGGVNRDYMVDYTSNNNAYENLSSEAITLSGTSVTATSEDLFLGQLTASSSGLSREFIPSDGGIATITQGTSKEVFSYTHFNNETNYLSYGDRGMFGSTSFSPVSGTNMTITFDISNDSENFTSLKDIVTDFSDDVNYLQLFFVPVDKNSYLAGGHALEDIDNYSNYPSGFIKYYNYKNGNEFIEAQGIRDISFLTNYLNNTLPINFSGNKFDRAFPLLPVYDNSSNSANTSTALIWTSRYESMKSYYYNYCRGNDLCGNCMGLTETRGFVCHVNNETINNYKNSTIVGNRDNLSSVSPLSSDERNSVKKSIYDNFTIPVIVSVVILSIIFIIIGAYIIYSKDTLTMKNIIGGNI